MMTTPATAATPTVSGYTLINSAGGVFDFGAAPAVGGILGESSSPVVGIAPDSTGKGYWVATANGGVFSVGDAKFYGSAGAMTLKAPIVAIVPTNDGGGYYLIGADGGVLTFGDAKYYGSAGNLALASPIVGASVTADGGATTSSARTAACSPSVTPSSPARCPRPSAGPPPTGRPSASPPTPRVRGYLIATSEGAIVAYGGAPFYGSPALSGVTPAEPVVSVTYAPDGSGYWAAAADGGVFAFNSSMTTGTGSSSTLVNTGHAGFFGSVPGVIGASGITNPNTVVGIAGRHSEPAVTTGASGASRCTLWKSPSPGRGSSRSASLSLGGGLAAVVLDAGRLRASMVLLHSYQISYKPNWITGAGTHAAG